MSVQLEKNLQGELWLASGSPRRQELLCLLNYPFQVCVSDIEEVVQATEPATDYVQRLSKEKAQAVYQLKQSSTSAETKVAVLGADTIVVSQGQILEKPSDLQDSKRILSLLSGQTHQVYTAVSLIAESQLDAPYQETKLIESRVSFKTLSEEEMINYWLTGEPQDKAGSYGIQGIGGKFVTHIDGNYHGIMGLPLFDTDELIQNYLRHLGVSNQHFFNLGS